MKKPPVRTLALAILLAAFAVPASAQQSKPWRHDETIKLTREMTGAKPDDPRPAFVIDEAVRVGAVAPDLPLPLDKLAAMQKVMIAAGSVPKAVDIGSMVDGSIRAEPLKLVGK